MTFSHQHELAVLGAAYARNPESQRVRSRLALLKARLGESTGVIDLLSGHESLSFAESLLLIGALLAQRKPQDDRKACVAAERAAADVTTDIERAAVLAELGKARARLGDERARAAFQLALSLDPGNIDACKRFAAWLSARGEAQEVLDFTNDIHNRGADHAQSFAARIVALTRLGRMDDAHALDGRRTLGLECVLAAPCGWAEIGQFNTALITELTGHPRLQFERPGTASEQTWRIDDLLGADAPLATVLIDQIRQTIDRHLAALTFSQHPWARKLRAGEILSASCLVAESDGHEMWHLHEFGSLSGVYYVAVPDRAETTNGHGGCLAFGLPPEIAGQDAADSFGVDIVRPEPGMLQLFPSHCFHRTYPHGGPGKRICIAFDHGPA